VTPPGLDPTFGHHGVVLTDLGGSSPEMGGYNDGEVVDVRHRIVVAATGLNPTGRRVLVVLRYLKDGTIDRSFGNGGHVRADIRGFNIPLDVAITDGGAILVLVWTGTKRETRGSVIVRYTARGLLDRSFGTDGRIDFPLTASPHRLVVLPDGRFFAVASGITLMRFMPDGQPDGSFGTSGVVTTSLGTPNDRAVNLSVLPNGKLLLVATSAINTSYDNWTFKLALVRYQANGALDVGFGRKGVRRFPMEDWSWAEDAAVDRDNKIVVLVSLSDGSHGCGDLPAGWEVVRRFLPNGDRDRSFGRDGHTSVREFEIKRVAVEPNGSLFVVGQGCTGTDPGRITWGVRGSAAQGGRVTPEDVRRPGVLGRPHRGPAGEAERDRAAAGRPSPGGRGCDGGSRVDPLPSGRRVGSEPAVVPRPASRISWSGRSRAVASVRGTIAQTQPGVASGEAAGRESRAGGSASPQTGDSPMG
jgi:uncharacterized delta-60 repeat protein